MAVERVFLWGPMGSGKSLVGRALADLWGTRCVDLDDHVAQRTGRTAAQWIEERGVGAFRRVEAESLEQVLADESAQVVALGGGALLDTADRRRALAAGTLITLTASLDTLLERVGSAQGRPLLSPDPKRALAKLLADRAEAYAECHAELATDGLSPDTLAQQIDAVVTDAPVVVPLGVRSYRVEVGPGVRARLLERAHKACAGERVLIVTDEGVLDPWGNQAQQALLAASWQSSVVTLPQGEQHKHIGSVERLWDAGLDAGLDRQSLIVAVGGGVVGDLAGFAAATLLRGMAFGQLPTTLLAMVDSAVGGKTGFDRRQGKNLVGAFHQPRFVLCDIEMLSTLPLAERRAGLAEVVKSAWLDGEHSVARLEAQADDLVAGDLMATADAVRMSVALKAAIVTRDEHEAGDRALLNLGHTLGHAIEVATDYTGLRHGEAVSLGMVAAFRLAERLGQGSRAHTQRITELLGRLGLPIDVDHYLDERTFGFLGSDKKRAGGKVRFVVPSAPGATSVVPLTLEQIPGLVR